MIKESITTLETAIEELEEKLENDESDEFINSDDFQKMYDDLKELEERTNGLIDSLPYDTASEKRLDEFDALSKSFKKCQKRIKKIDDETDINDGNDSSWMFDDDN